MSRSYPMQEMPRYFMESIYDLYIHLELKKSLELSMSVTNPQCKYPIHDLAIVSPWDNSQRQLFLVPQLQVYVCHKQGGEA